MYLGRIVIGKNCQIGLKSHISPGSVLPQDTFIGPNSSSHEINPLNDPNGSTNGQGPDCHVFLWVLLIYPAKIAVLLFSTLPWMTGYYCMAAKQPSVTSDSVKNIISWQAQRLSWRYLSVTLSTVLGPFFWFAAVVGVKKLVDTSIGKVSAHSADGRT
jgi:hypothetical protein